MAKLATYRAKHEPPRGDAPRLPACILHVDMDAFFVSVELLSRPELRGKPVVVGGRPDQRGVVSAASYEARKFGIQSAMPLRTAARLCPHAVFLDGNHRSYTEWSDRIAAILLRYTPVVEMASIDEAYMDFTGTERLHGPPFAAAHKLLTEITSSTGLPCSGGLTATRLVSKVASDQAKPRGLVYVPPGSEEAFLAPLSVRKIPGIGRVTESALQSLGILTVGDLAAISLERLEEAFGRWGTALWRKARGQDAFEFFVDAEPKSISHNHTFAENTADGALLESTLCHLTEKAAKRLREAGLGARTVCLTLRFSNFKTISRRQMLPDAAQADSEFLAKLRGLLQQTWDGRAQMRLIGVELSHFTTVAGPAGTPRQLDLLEPGRREKLEALARAADKLRERFGFEKVQLGGSLLRREPD